MKAAAALIAAGIIILFMPTMMSSIDDFRFSEREESFVVASGSNSTVVTLSQDLYNDDTVNVTDVSSNQTLDAPIASNYNEGTNALTITGLNTGIAHYLTVTYNIDGLTEYPGAGSGAKITPVLLVLGVVCIVAGAGYQTFRRGD